MGVSPSHLHRNLKLHFVLCQKQLNTSGAGAGKLNSYGPVLSTQGHAFPVFVRSLGTSREAAWAALGFAGHVFVHVEVDGLIMVLSKLAVGSCSSPWIPLVHLTLSCNNLIWSREISGTVHVQKATSIAFSL